MVAVYSEDQTEALHTPWARCRDLTATAAGMYSCHCALQGYTSIFQS
jgi:hypothetical protein